MPNAIPLAARERAGERVKHRLVDFLMQFEPARELRICDVECITNMARMFAFEEFSEAYETGGFDGPTGAD